MDELRRTLAADPRIAYALVFGSTARRSAHADSDIDIAIGLTAGTQLEPLALGDLISKLEQVAGRSIDLVVLDEAPPPIAYRVFRDGHIIVDTNHRALVERKTRAILEYLDFQPVEALAARGVLAAAARGR